MEFVARGTRELWTGWTFARSKRHREAGLVKLLGRAVREGKNRQKLQEKQEERRIVGEEEEQSRSGYKYVAPPAPNVHLRTD